MLSLRQSQAGDTRLAATGELKDAPGTAIPITSMVAVPRRAVVKGRDVVPPSKPAPWVIAGERTRLGVPAPVCNRGTDCDEDMVVVVVVVVVIVLVTRDGGLMSAAEEVLAATPCTGNDGGVRDATSTACSQNRFHREAHIKTRPLKHVC